MLNQVAEALRARARLITLNHPNSMDCEVWRKTVKRTFGAGAQPIGGLPTLGGIAVLDPEDETEPEYECIGEGKVQFCNIYERTTMHDSRESAEQQEVAEALIEPLMPCAFEPKDSDLVMAFPGGGAVIPYEVTRVINTANIPPYAPKYELRAQGDLVFDPSIKAEFDAR
jgi:hypothetical protein